MNEPRPAMISARPLESRSSVANCWKTRMGSSELSTVTALVSRIRSVASAIAPSATTGADTAKSGRWCSPDSEHVEADLVGHARLLDEIAQALLGGDRRRQLGEGVDADLHG